MAHDDDLQTKHTPTTRWGLSDTPMMGTPSEFDFAPMTRISEEDLNAALAQARPGFRAREVEARVLAASRGETLESPMADLRRGVR